MWIKCIYVACCMLLLAGCAGAATQESSAAAPKQRSTPRAIAIASDAPAAERHAAEELARYLKEMTGAEFNVVDAADSLDAPVIAVGPAAALTVSPDLDLSIDSLGQEGIVVSTKDANWVLTGAVGASRGTLYAVYTFLDRLGVRWWSPTETHVPQLASLEVPKLDIRYVPAVEYREIHAIDAFDADWAVRNRTNGHSSNIPPEKGGKISYAGPFFVHTFETFVPAKEYFPSHPDWFPLINGQRVGPPAYAQLCLTNAELLAFMKQKVREAAATVPPGTDAIISVSQNDNALRCQCDKCLAIEAEEGSPSGPMLRFVNAVADDIKNDYPRIAIDTLAYQYTRKAPKITRPRDNVIVRLCSIECSFAQPYTAPINQAFADDVREWSKICKRLYIWDYVTNFRFYVHPHPNLYPLGPNVKFFVDNGVRGLFMQGNRHSAGGDFAVLKQWVLAQLLWDPSLDGRTLIDTFVTEYYEAAAPQIAEYIELRETAVKDAFLGVSENHLATFLTPDLLAQSYDMLQQAKSNVSDKPHIVARVEQLEAGVLHAIVRGWPQRKQLAAMAGQDWPLDQPYEFYLNELARILREQNITTLSEGRVEGNLSDWIESIRGASGEAAPPAEVAKLPRSDWFDLQNRAFLLYGEDAGRVRHGDDPKASDGSAAIMNGDHVDWDVQATLNELPGGEPGKTWTIYASIRVEKTGETASGNAMTFGIYDGLKGAHLVPAIAVGLSQILDDEYHLYRIGTVELDSTRFVWVAPPGNSQVKRVSVDRFLFVRGNKELNAPPRGGE